MSTGRQRERKKLRAKFHSIMQSRKARREAPSSSHPGVIVQAEEVPSLTLRTAEAIKAYRAESVDAWDYAKRRRQSKVKTWGLWQARLEELGYFFRSQGDHLKVYKDGIEVGDVVVFSSGPHA